MAEVYLVKLPSDEHHWTLLQSSRMDFTLRLPITSAIWILRLTWQTCWRDFVKTVTDKSTLFQVMAWCRQATSHYLNQCWPRSMSPYGVTRPQWVKRVRHSPVWGMGRCLYTGCSQIQPLVSQDSFTILCKPQACAPGRRTGSKISGTGEFDRDQH